MAALRQTFVASTARERNVVLALLLYTVVWAVYGTISKGSQGLHPDMTEQIAWSRQLAWGYDKHGPAAAVLVWAWFSVLPVAGWSYYLLAMLMPAAALWLMWRLSADYLEVEKRVVGVALMTFVPFFNFQALKYNVNTVLLPMWALTIWWFLRSYERQSLVYAALAGLAAAAAMMTKYWSVFLLAGLVVAALTDEHRARYFRSPAPWVTFLAGLALLTPHLYWLTQHGYAPFHYALSVHDTDPYWEGPVSGLSYLAGAYGYVAVPVVVVLSLARWDGATLTEMIWPKAPERRLVAASYWAPLLMPLIAAFGAGVVLTSLWSMSAFALLPVLLLAPQGVQVRPATTQWILAAAAIFPVIMVSVSPFVADETRPAGPPPAAVEAPTLAARVEQIWHKTTSRPLRFIGGDGDIAYPVVAYAADRPRLLEPGLAAPSPAALKRAGRVVICYAGDRGCLGQATRMEGRGARVLARSEITLHAARDAKPARAYVVVVIPPQL